LHGAWIDSSRFLKDKGLRAQNNSAMHAGSLRVSGRGDAKTVLLKRKRDVGMQPTGAKGTSRVRGLHDLLYQQIVSDPLELCLIVNALTEPD
jgi:hypothetical protein